MLETQRLSPTFYTALQDDLRAELASAGLDAMLADDPEDVAYLTGFFHHPGERPVAVLLPTDGTTRLLLPELEREHAQAQHSAAELVAYPEFPGLRPQFSYLAPVTGRIGYAGSMSVDRLAQITAAFPGATMIRTDLVTRARYRKRPEEIALHAEAARITDLMLAAGRTLIEDAVAGGGELPSEAELADHITTVGTRTMYAEHADVVVVSPLAGGLVYAGPNSARPHALPSGYRLRPGDTFMLSLGCAVGGRFVEGERTFILGEPTADQRRYYEAVRQAQQTGGEALRPGVLCSQANTECLDVIRAAGLGEYLRHRQGHGIGLGMHEPPWLADGDDTPLEVGMVVSNEPGIYIPGHAGYRISDSMLITQDGARPFTSYPRSLDDVVVAL
ncbi:M24 family metallopeptidase [Micromonospora sp. NBC_01796]|uniref:M24 family metallopeptidase n=1 Tax=Micromonospora sp. NBC_01796 TaxID=2975987 RepID=UPI002DD89C93|nr:Xaa-Pro peptidase family protein [Micromonospora sp. NBC_01796]WSA84617.1 Xaa-Pro peptidase family protein [Micromonospora sp. NBC_01796]